MNSSDVAPEKISLDDSFASPTKREFTVLFDPTEKQIVEMNVMAQAMLTAVGKLDVTLLWQTGVFTYADESGQIP